MKTDKNVLSLVGSARTFIEFTKQHEFILDDNHKVIIPQDITRKDRTTFLFESRVESKNIRAARFESISVLTDFFNKMIFYLDVPLDSIEIHEEKFERSGITLSVGERLVEISGSVVATDSAMDDFKKFTKKPDTTTYNTLLSLYAVCRVEKPIVSYWTIYSIMQILIGERSSIDNYFKTYYPEIPLVYSDHLKSKISLFVAIRDSFSHKATFDGSRLEINSILSKKISFFRKVARELIGSKFEVTAKL